MKRPAQACTITTATWRRLGDYLLDYYAKAAQAAGMDGQGARRRAALPLGDRLPILLVGRLEAEPGRRDLRARSGDGHSRQDRRRAIIMGDHYDTAYMEDVYGYFGKGGGPRIAAAGADDNHSATAAMMLAAPIFLDLRQARQAGVGHLARASDGRRIPVGLHGRRALCQRVVEGSLKIRLTDGRWRTSPRPASRASM